MDDSWKQLRGRRSMRKILVSLPGAFFNVFVFCALLLVALSFSWGQSCEVHVVPRTSSTKSPPKPEMAPAEGSPELFVRTRPLRADVDLVLVPVVVNDARERPVLSLKKEDFALYEDGKVQEIRYFSSDAGPVSIALLLDVSKSMTDKIDQERAAITQFFQNADPQDEYFAISFSGRPRLLASSTQSIDELQNDLTSIEPGGSTAMLDAVYLAEAALRSARYKRKAILIISDGGDNASRYTLREIRRLVEESDPQIYGIGLFETFFFNTLEERMGKRWLSEITDVTGGHTITVDNRAQLPEAAAEISREIRSEYILGYRPESGTPNKWRKIKVQITSASHVHRLRAYYKAGYIMGGE
jgi:Ca-activated chloride channel homolog